ncbi:phosphotransferase [Frankia sp. R82]|uniref:phosphotransferase enzyme family protein n=1 Tax=Frankia sp. R82 TaxID=2950553 RepID=UPI00204335F5|nr:phosphotransferase [Frankia sp. R82]MCM3884285.1 phosphotransferase [Frankia sp. R82]
MDLETVPATVSRNLAHDHLLSRVLAAYDLGPSPRAKLLHVSENVTYEITEGDIEGAVAPALAVVGAALGPERRRWALRLLRPGYQSSAEVHSELAWIAALRRDGIVRTPPVILTRSGASMVTVRSQKVSEGGGGSVDADQHAVLFAWVAGRSPETLETAMLPGVFAQIGEIAARLHRHARGWVRPSAFHRFAWNWDTTLGAATRWGGWSAGLTGALASASGPDSGAAHTAASDPDALAAHALVGRAVKVIRSRLEAYGMGSGRYGLIHADMRLANLLFPEAKIRNERAVGPRKIGAEWGYQAACDDEVCVIDFDDCGFGWYLWDLAASLSFIEHLDVAGDLVDAWLTAYQRRLPLTAEDVAMIPTFVLMRRLLLVAWLGTHPHSDAVASRADYARDTCTLAEAYLSGRLLAG